MTIRTNDTTRSFKRRYPIGAELIGPDQTHFRVWAPKAQRVDLVLEGSAAKIPGQEFHALASEKGGYFSGSANAGAGACYRFRVNDRSYPDPASRFQPDGPHGPSCIVDPAGFRWTDSHWPGVILKGQIIYEMHIGTFTKEGAWRAAAQQLEELAHIGITVIEMMPVATSASLAGDMMASTFSPFHICMELRTIYVASLIAHTRSAWVSFST